MPIEQATSAVSEHVHTYNSELCFDRKKPTKRYGFRLQAGAAITRAGCRESQHQKMAGPKKGYPSDSEMDVRITLTQAECQPQNWVPGAAVNYVPNVKSGLPLPCLHA